MRISPPHHLSNYNHSTSGDPAWTTNHLELRHVVLDDLHHDVLVDRPRRTVAHWLPTQMRGARSEICPSPPVLSIHCSSSPSRPTVHRPHPHANVLVAVRSMTMIGPPLQKSSPLSASFSHPHATPLEVFAVPYGALCVRSVGSSRGRHWSCVRCTSSCDKVQSYQDSRTRRLPIPLVPKVGSARGVGT